MTKIVIVGAGIAGLAAANHLTKHGFDVTILEARARAGGRICVDDSLGIPLATGAHWIHGAKNNPMVELAQRFSSPYVPFAAHKSYVFTDHGQIVPTEMILDVSQKFEAALAKAKQYALNAPHDCALSIALEKFWPTHMSNSFESAIFAKELKFFENYMGESYEKLSARYWDISEPYSGEHYLVLDGFSAIVNGLTALCDIEFNTCIQEIHYGSEKVELFTQDKKYTADKVIVTLPLGVLKKNSVKFSPPIPLIKQQAIDAVGMGLFDIIKLQFPTVFWPQDSSFFFTFNTGETLTCNIFVNLQPFLQKPILYGYVGGATARALEKLPQNAISAKIMQTLRSTFGPQTPAPTFFDMTHWENDPFSCGAYSYTAVGATAAHYLALAEPIADRLYFAGEATNAHLYDATTHGAYLSGIREANRIIG